MNRWIFVEVTFGRLIWVQALHNSLNGANLTVEVTALHARLPPFIALAFGLRWNRFAFEGMTNCRSIKLNGQSSVWLQSPGDTNIRLGTSRSQVRISPCRSSSRA